MKTIDGNHKVYVFAPGEFKCFETAFVEIYEGIVYLSGGQMLPLTSVAYFEAVDAVQDSQQK